MESETIFGLATSPGRSAIAVVRIDGPAVPQVSASALPSLPVDSVRRAHVGPYLAVDGTEIDRVVALRYLKPKSYTGGDVLEVSLHGNPLLVQKILEDLRARGLRQADPGEFTRRAFLAGKLDLSQAEAVADLIEARNDAALAGARRQLAGGLGEEIGSVVSDLLDLRAQVEAYLDFPEEDLPGEETEGPVRALAGMRNRLGRMIETGRLRELLHHGVRVLILGAPNAGKSSLLNFLLGHERAIVDARPGTTRDFIEDEFALGPWSIRIIDTAGLRDARDPVEIQGVERTISLAATADYFLLVEDGTAPSPSLPPAVAERMTGANTFHLLNKKDAPGYSATSAIRGEWPFQEVSLLRGEGLGEFLEAWRRHLSSDLLAGATDRILYNERHIALLRETLGHVQRALDLAEGDTDRLLVAVELREAVEVLGALCEGSDNEAMLDRLFSRFCIGK